VVTITDAPQPARRRLRKAKPKEVAPPAEPGALPMTLLTAVRPQPLGDDEAARSWLAAMRDDEDAIDAEVSDALVLINSAVHAHRVASLDGHLADVSPAHALTVRIGFGDGEALADGRWDEAIELPRGARRKRSELLAPQEKVAAILGGRDDLDAATGALLHARADLDAGRMRDCALQIRIGLEAMLADRETFGSSGQEDDLAALEGRRAITGETANEALRSALSAERAAELTETLRLAERVLRRRRAFG